MTDFLVKLFVKNSDLTKRTDVREKYGVFTSIVGVFVNIILAAMKLTVGLLSGSIAIVADAINNFSDAGSSIVTFISFKIAAKPADKDHPFGHARIEYICSMAVSFLILLVGAELMMESVGGLFSGKDGTTAFSTVTFIVLGVSVIMKLWLSIFYRKIAKKIDSSVIKASSVDSMADAVSTFAVLVCGVIIKYTGFAILDSIVGMGVSVMILVAGIKVLNETKNSILGEAPVEETVNLIKSTVAKYPEVIGIHDLLVHNYGPKHYIASFHAEVDGAMDIYVLHDTIDNIEREINETLGILCTIHMDPIEKNNATVNELKAFTERIISALYSEITIHDFRTVVGKTHTNLIFDIAVPFDEKEDVSEIVNKIKTAISEERSECFCVITVDRV